MRPVPIDNMFPVSAMRCCSIFLIVTLHGVYCQNDSFTDHIPSSTLTSSTKIPDDTAMSFNGSGVILSAETRLVNSILQRHSVVGSASRPILNSSRTVLVQFSMALFQLLALDEKAQILSTKFWKGYFWTDEYLVWDPAENNGITQIQVPVTQVWSPDIVLYNNAGDEPPIPARAIMPVTYKGEANWVLPIIYTSTCEIDMNLFPFDEQTCNFTFGSWSYNLHKLNLVIYANLTSIDLSSYVPSSQWDVVSTSATRIVENYSNGTVPWPLLIYSLTVRRRVGFYVYVLIVPSLVLSLLTPGLFWIPPSRPDRTTLGMSLFSSFFVLLLVLVQSSPSSASVSKLGIYYCFNMTLIALSTILSAIVIYVSNNYHKQPVPRWMRTIFIQTLAKVLLSRLEKYNDPPVPKTVAARPSLSADNCRGEKNGNLMQLETISATVSNGNRKNDFGAIISATAAAAADSLSMSNNVTSSREHWSSAAVPDMSNQMSWKIIIAVLDRLFFIISVIANCLSIALVFPK